MNPKESSIIHTQEYSGATSLLSEAECSVNIASDLNWQFLSSELERIDHYIQRQVHLWQLSGQDPQDDLKGLYISDQDIANLLQRSFASHWGEMVRDASFDQDFSSLLERSHRASQNILSEAEQLGQTPRLAQLSRLFHLDEFEVNTLLVCLAPLLDLRYEKIYAYLQDDVTRKRPSINLILDLFSDAGKGRFKAWKYFQPEAPLFKNHLLNITSEIQNTPLLNRELLLDSQIAFWLLGHELQLTNFRKYISIEQLHKKEPFKVSADHPNIDFSEFSQNEPPVLILFGADHYQQENIAHQAAIARGQALLEIQLETAIQEGIDLLPVMRRTLRDAYLHNAAVSLSSWDAVNDLDPEQAVQLLYEVCRYPGQVIIAGKKHWVAKGFHRQRNLLWLETSLPSYPVRLKLWKHYLENKPVQEPISWFALAGQFQLTTDQIRDASATAWDSAQQRKSPILSTDLFAAARAHSNPSLSNLARKIIPRYAWKDLIIPTDQLQILHELVNTVLGRPLVLDEWGLAQKLASSRGVTVLFSGPPGTGKTMAAEVISAELGLDLYKIDLSTVISKYIGETEKNLEQIFFEAETSNAILFFDEADALFGKRSEVRDSHDRYANIEISYLLQRMEAYDGVTILATNLRANMDEAFKRRLQFAVDFPFPEEKDRLRIWQTLFPQNAPSSNDIDLPLLARRFKFAGGNIRNILVSAAYLAAADGGQLSMEHLFHGAKRELQKMGRLVDNPDMFSINDLGSSQ